MQAPFCLVAVCFLLGAALGGAGLTAPELCVWLLPTLYVLSAFCWRLGREQAFIVLVLLAYGSAGAILGAVSERSLRRTHVRVLFDRDLAQHVTSYVHASPSLLVWGATLPPARAEFGLFPGLTLLCLASVGLLAGFARDEAGSEGASPIRDVARCYGLVGLLALLLSLGPEPRVLGYALPFTGPYE